MNDSHISIQAHIYTYKEFGFYSKILYLLNIYYIELCLPIITLGIGSLSERVYHGVTGFIAKNNNEFSQYALNVFKDDKLWNDLRLNLLNLRGKKTWEKCAKTLIDNI